MYNKPIGIKACIKILSISIIIFFCACSEKIDEFTIGNDFIVSQTHVLVVDTFSVELSTVIIDSLPTSGTGVLITGNYQDSIFGKVTCNGYFQVGLPYNRPKENTDFYDSLALMLVHSNYSYGDTNQNQVLRIHRLKELIKTEGSEYLYSSSLFDYDLNPIGSKSFIPRYGSIDSLGIRLSDTLGEELFHILLENSEITSSQENFLNYFKGIAIIADENQQGSIIAFKANEGDIKLRLYTHRIGENLTKINYDFTLFDASKQFNQVHYEFENTAINALEKQSESLPSAKTYNKAYIQGGTGLMTKIQFPSLNDILMFEQGIIIEAQLILKPEKGSYNVFSLPRELYLFETNKINRFGNVLYDAYGNAIVPQFTLDKLYNDNTTYTFDVTSFLTNELSDNYFDIEHGLLLSLTSEDLISSFERIILDARNPKLKIYYLTF